jgi:Transposase DNA-binding
MIERWVRQELEKTQLGDPRRTNRFMKIVSNLSNKPESSVPEASGTWAETKATYDFWDSPYIKPAQLRKGHVDATLERIKNHQIVLAIQDTTELNYTTHIIPVGPKCAIGKNPDRPNSPYISSYFCQLSC